MRSCTRPMIWLVLDSIREVFVYFQGRQRRMRDSNDGAEDIGLPWENTNTAMAPRQKSRHGKSGGKQRLKKKLGMFHWEPWRRLLPVYTDACLVALLFSCRETRSKLLA
ncbi:hypothetical protein FQA47_020193 [Oryzias melastigma]|uniref:Uncharacterized protein n=1 Tax=Oryzias melastigma TaxID=30732 RepID=A0A834BWD7_ORYME|nr:hypothetical protein FQA47_020193 [Oryzias melastigma]